jgi:short-subunit dehydrogenase
MNAEKAAPVHTTVLDLTSSNAPQSLFGEAIRVFGMVHILVNNAGMSPYQDFHEMKAIHIQQSLQLNIQALTELCHHFIPHMLAHGEPSHIVNLGSVGGYAPLPHFAVYTGSKHYVRILSDQLHFEFRDTNIQVSALHPGGVHSEFAELAGQKINRRAGLVMMAPEDFTAKAYPAILKGKRVIIPGGLNKLTCLIGKILPFPWSIRVMAFLYDQNIEKAPPTYGE